LTPLVACNNLHQQSSEVFLSSSSSSSSISAFAKTHCCYSGCLNHYFLFIYLFSFFLFLFSFFFFLSFYFPPTYLLPSLPPSLLLLSFLSFLFCFPPIFGCFSADFRDYRDTVLCLPDWHKVFVYSV